MSENELRPVSILLTVDPEIPVPPLTYGGIERVVDLLVRSFRARGHRVGLVAHPASTSQATECYAWRGLRSQNRLDSVANAFQLRRIITDFRPDIVHSFSRLLYLLPAMRASLPKLMSYQREPTARAIRSANRLFGNSVVFTGCSEYICGNGRSAGGEWHAIHNPVDTEQLAFSACVPADAPLVFLSRVESIKGAHIAIDIAKRSGKRLLIAGNTAAQGAELHYWEQRIRPHVGKDGIEYIGPVNDVQKNDLLGQASALVVPVTWNEPFGIVFAEALACGTPVISSPRGALPEIIRNGVEGFLVDTLEAACEAVARLPSIDRKTCRLRAEGCFSSSVISRKYEALYERHMRAVAESPKARRNA